MEVIISWIQEYWHVVVIIIGILIKILNRLTKHFSEHKGFVKGILFLIDILDLVKTTPAPGKAKNFLDLAGFLKITFIGLAAIIGVSCVTTNGKKVFSPEKAMNIACASVPVIDIVHTLVCGALPPDKRAKCYRAKAKAKIAQDVILTVGQAILSECPIPQQTNVQ